jgi:hypothetical protein
MELSERAAAFLDAADWAQWSLFNHLFAPDVINAYDPMRKFRALDRCIVHHNIPGLRRLLEAKAEVNYMYNRDRRMSPLHRAVDFSQIDSVNLLLRYNADINARDADGYTPLAYLGPNDGHLAHLLFEYGADPLLCKSPSWFQLPFVSRYRRAFARCRLAQRAWLRIFLVHRRDTLVPDMVRLIGDVIWKTRVQWVGYV